MRRLRRMRERAVARIVASDPSHQRLRMAVRGTLAVGAAVLVIGVLSRLLGQSILPAAPGVIVAMIGTMAVNDVTRRARMITLALGVLSAFGGVAVGSLLRSEFRQPRRVRRRRGCGDVPAALRAAGMALGMLGFMSYFMAIFLRIPTGALWWTALAVCCGALVAGLVKEALVPDRPVGDLRRTVDAFVTRIGEVRRAAEQLARDGDDGIDGRLRSRLRRRILSLRETELAIDSQLGDSDDETSLRLHDLVLHATLAAEAFSECAVHGGDLCDAGDELMGIVAELREAGRSARPADESDADATDSDDADSRTRARTSRAAGSHPTSARRCRPRSPPAWPCRSVW